MKSKIKGISVLLSILAAMLTSSLAHAQPSVIRAVLFFSSSCPHCHIVMEQTLPPLVDKYDGQLDIVGIDVNQPLGQELYSAAVYAFNIPNDRLGIPTLIVGDTVLIGTEEIPKEFPGIIERGLANGGIDWPGIPGLPQVLAAQPPAAEHESEEGVPSSYRPAFVSKFGNDLLANHIAVIVLLGMVACVISVGYSFIKAPEAGYIRWPKWVLPMLTVLGLGVATYLSYVEATDSKAICGPVGNCNSVQQSPYAYLFGIIPIGILGVVGYLAVLIAWILTEIGPQPWRRYFSIAIWGMGWFGVLFSIYLTFLEPFVIGATCAWCLSSAVIMTLIFLGSTEAAIHALAIPGGDSLLDGEKGDDDEHKETELNPNA